MSLPRAALIALATLAVACGPAEKPAALTVQDDIVKTAPDRARLLLENDHLAAARRGRHVNGSATAFIRSERHPFAVGRKNPVPGTEARDLERLRLWSVAIRKVHQDHSTAARVGIVELNSAPSRRPVCYSL